ncbi:LysR substrate-binding domain-containing protein [Rhizobium multihospitium]|uniref:LysR substrate-binding domain-containing protein n=1 Tax=Rhizobium multihospitium TaxID=410764 RepID=UPI001FD9B770|nr:LysR substrate-binding domain-containing protein [Rhizobium multihospitium]
MHAFRARYPDITVELTEMNSPALEQALLAGRINLRILHPPIAISFRRSHR